MKFYGVTKFRRLILSFSSVLRRDRRIAKSDYYFCNVCLSSCPYAWNNSTLTGRIFTKFDISVFSKNMSKKIQVSLNLTRITGTLREDLSIFMIISH